jgi:hypothetical protein
MLQQHIARPPDSFQSIQFYPRPNYPARAILLTDIEETKPYLGALQRLHYYCLVCQPLLSVDEHGILSEQWFSFVYY